MQIMDQSAVPSFCCFFFQITTASEVLVQFFYIERQFFQKKNMSNHTQPSEIPSSEIPKAIAIERKNKKSKRQFNNSLVKI